MKTFILSAMLCFATFGAFGQNSEESEPPVSIIMMGHTNTNQSNSDNQERSLQYWEVSAYVYPAPGVVEVCLYNIGDATISLVNANGEVVDSTEVGTNIPSTVTLQTDGSSNTYYIVVFSSSIYAEGSFEI